MAKAITAETANVLVGTWGNGLGLRISKALAKRAGVAAGTPVQIVSTPGRIVIEVAKEPTLDDMLAQFDPKRHAGELMAFKPIGKEVV